MAFIIDNFSALYNSKESIKALKGKILDLAIQGRIMPYEESDGTALEVLQAISNAKEHLCTLKKHKNQDAQLPISLDEIPFEIPESWVWKRLGDLVSNRTGLTYHKDNLGEKSPTMVRVLRGGNIDDLEYRFFENDIMISSQFVKDDLYLCRNDLITPAVSSIEQIGKMARIEKDYPDAVVGGFVLILKPFLNDDIHVSYLLYTLSSRYHRENCRAITNKSGQAFYNLSREKLLNLLIPVPPHQTQKRIVQRIQELYALCDKLENAIVQQKSFLDKLPKAVVDAIGSSSTSEDLRRNLLFVLDNFKTIFQDADSMKELRNVVLQLAIEGKLAPQDESDEPASELLKKIKGEKERLVREKKIKKSNPLAPVTEDEIPFEISENWCWTRLGNLAEVKGGKRVSVGYTMLTQKTGHVYIRVTDMKYGTVDLCDLRYIDESEYLKIHNYTISSDDLYVSIAGTIGAVGVVPIELDGMNLTENAAKIVFYDKTSILQKYMYFVMSSSFSQGQFSQMVNQMAQPKLALIRLASTLIALPPFSEQKRIVHRVEDIMKLIDQMENQLKRKADIVKKMVAIS